MWSLFIAFSNKRFLIGFSVITFGFVCVVETYLRTYVIKTEPLAQKSHYVYTAKKTDVVFGDSHGKCAFAEQPQLLNFSMPGASVKLWLLFAKEYFRFRKPGRVILVASPQVFSKSRIQQDIASYDDLFRFNFSVPIPYIFEPGISQFIQKIKPSHLKFIWDHFVQNKPIPIDPLSTQKWSEVPRNQQIQKTLSRIKHQTPIENYKASEDYSAYHNLIKFLKSKGAEVCMIQTPVTHDYREQSLKLPLFGSAEASFREIAKQHRVPYVEYLPLSMTYDDSLFINQDHLNLEGASLYTPLVIEDCFGI